MKKKPILIALCSILILAVAVVAIIKFTGFANKPDGSTDTMELNEVSGYVLKKGFSISLICPQKLSNGLKSTMR